MKEEDYILKGNSEQKAYRIAYLVARFIREELTETEHDELDNWINLTPYNQQMFEKLIDPDHLADWSQWRDKLDTLDKYEKVKRLINPESANNKSGIRLILPWLVAACLFAAVSIPFYLIIKRHKILERASTAASKDIPPGSNKARLTLSDGSIVVLDSLQNAGITRQGGTDVAKKDSEMIVYTPAANNPVGAVVGYNTLTTPKAGKFKVQLPDGSLVWINAVSSLKYPTVFSGKERRLELSGEAYFEVVKDAVHPFIVETNGAVIEVLGTHFNINSYADEPLMKITLAEGVVKINQSVTLKPGEQAQLNNTDPKSTDVKVVKGIDLETELGWKEGLFVFKSTPLTEVMRQAARWYDAEIEYQYNSTDHFNAEILRDTPVSKLLHLLEGTGRVHFKIENRKIIVMK